MLSIVSMALPPGLLPAWLPSAAPKIADAETVSSPHYVSAALMPNGQVGLLFQNVNGSNAETRFVGYTGEHALSQSIQLSTAAPGYPQLAVLGSTLVAGYVDTRAPNNGKLVLRTSTDNGATWTAEATPFGSEIFDTANFAPRVVASHSGTTLYVFKATSGSVPTYRSTTDLSSWTSAAAAGDSSMRLPSGNNCGSAGQECYRAHAFGFMETATAGSWVYITKSDAGWGQSGRGTQVGTLGGSWSTQVDHGGSGGLSGGGESTATTFLGRDGSVYYVRAGGYGEDLYFERSTNGGATWGGQVHAYTPIPIYTTAAPVGLYVPGYSLGEYVWYAGFGGSEDTVRMIPLWDGPKAYPDTGTIRLFGSVGGDLDPGSAFEYNFGALVRSLGAGGYVTSATDLALPGRLLNFGFTRTSNSPDGFDSGPLGRGWNHSYNWRLIENGDLVTIRRGDGRQDRFTRNPDGTFAAPLGVFDVLTKNADNSYTLTAPNQVQHEFSATSHPSSAYPAAVQTDAPAAYWRLGEGSGTSAADAGPNGNTGTYSGAYTLAQPGALHDPSTAASFNGSGKVTTGVTGIPAGTTARTVEAWIMPNGSSGTILAINAASGQKFVVQAALIGSSWYLFTDGINGANNLTLSGTEIPPLGVWSHVAFVFDGSANTWHYYLNGVATKSGTFGVAINTATPTSVTIGDRLDYSQPFSGTIDEVAVYGSALSAAQIAAHYAAVDRSEGGLLNRIHEPAGNQIALSYTGRDLTTITDTVGRQVVLSYDTNHHLTQLQDPAARKVSYAYDSAGRLIAVWDKLLPAGGQYPSTVQADSPAAYWRLGESSGTSAADAGPNGNTGTYSGGYTLAQAGALHDASTAVAFNGSTAKVTAGVSGVPTGTAARTIEAWIRPTGNGGTIFATNAASGQKFVVLAALIGGSWYLFTDGVNGANNLTLTGAEIPPTGQWSHIAFVFDGTANTWRYYLNGAATKNGTFGVSINTATLTSTTIAERLDFSQPFSGSIDELAVYPSALSAARIAAHYQAGLAASWFYTYDGRSAHVATVTDPDGRVVATNTFDALGRLATQKDGLGKTTTFGYASGATTVTDPRSHTTTMSYDARNRPIQQDDPVGGTTYHQYFTYDDCGNRSSVTDRNGNRTDLTYDTACKGNLLERQEPQLNPQTPRFTTDWTYDSKNNPTQQTDAKGFVSTSTYDATTNVQLSATSPIDASTSATTKWIYGDTSNPGRATRVVGPRGNTTGTPNNTYSTVLAYDSSGNLTSSTDADGSRTTYSYDSLGRPTSMVDPDGNATGGTPSQHTWTTAYDALDRVTSATDPLNHSTGSTFDGAGHVLTSTDKNGNVTTYTYDAASRLVTVVQKPDPTNQPTLTYTTSIGRDDNGNAIAVTQANGVVTNYAFDALNRLTSMTSHPASGTNLVTSYTLDGNGNTLTRTTADSVVTTYTYDNLSRPTQVAAAGLSTIGYAYDELSRRTSMADGTGTTTYSYDRMGRLAQAAQPNGTLAYGYDLDSNRTTLTYPGSNAVTYTYSNAGRLSSLQDWGSRSTSYTYSPAGLAKTAALPNGLVTTYTYDRAQRLTALTNVVGSTTITSHSYTLDAEGNRTAQTEFVSGITTGPSDSFGYTYDGLNRLTAVTTTSAESFALDSASNIASRTGPSATYSYDTSNRLTSDGSSTFTWSAADRLTGRGSDVFGYDPLDRLTSAAVSGTSRTYAYNGDGLLQSRTQGGATTNLLWDPATSPSRLLMVASDKVVYGLGPLYVVTGSGTITLARDGGKSVRAELNGSGAVTASFRYKAYGAIAQSNGASAPTYLGYAGQLLDPSGLDYMRARWYDPSSQRFLTADPLRSDPTSGLTSPFAYANANPIVLGDPTGLAATTGSDGGGHCQYVATCGSDFRGVLDAVHGESDAIEAAVQSDNPVIAATGWIEAGAVAVAAGALVVAGAALAAGGAAAAAGAEVGAVGLATRIYVIGENALDRVNPFTSAIGAATMPALSSGSTQTLKDAATRESVNAAMDANMIIINLGRDPARVEAGRRIGTYYLAELQEIVERGYTRVIDWR
jgi:RHS repeat-associated protein